MKFEPGKTYSTRSICDSNCVFTLLVKSRTAKTIRAIIDGKEKTLRVSSDPDCEYVWPLGKYSMCPIIRSK